MLSFEEWIDEENEAVGAHALRLLSVADEKIDDARQRTIGVMPEHYASPEMIARTLDRLGKPAVANLLRTRLPTQKTKRSGDLGEILATEYIDERSDFSVPIKRLRWKDHREMPMRGDDIIAIQQPEAGGRIRFLKGEAKSKATLNTDTVTKARSALDSDNGLPSSHALAFVMERLIEIGEEEISDMISQALLVDGISSGQVTHMIFTFSGNNPTGFLKADIEDYDGSISQLSIGLRIVQHQEFIASVYDEMLGGHES